MPTSSSPTTGGHGVNRDLILQLLVAVLPFAIAMRFITIPLSHDDGVYLAMGRGLANGQLPYRDLFDHKPPLIYLWFWLFNDLTAVRVSLALVVSATTLVVTDIGREFYGRRGYIAGVAFALTPGFVGIISNASADQLVLLPATGALWAALRGRPFLAGVLIALAAMRTPVVGFEVVALLLLARRDWWRVALGGAVGTIAVILPVVAAGLGPAAYDAVITFNREYAREGWRNAGESTARTPYRWTLAVPLLVPAVAAAPFAPRRLQLWAAACLLGVLLPGRLFPYYAWHVLPAAALLVPALADPLRRLPRPARLMLLPLGSSALALVALPSLYLFVNPSGALDNPSAYNAIVRVVHGRVWVVGNVPQIYYLSGTVPANRVLHPAPFAIRPGAFEHATAEVRSDPPDFIVLSGDPTWDTPTRAAFPEFQPLCVEARWRCSPPQPPIREARNCCRTVRA